MSKLELHTFDVKLDKTTKVLTAIVFFTLALTIYLLANRVILYSHKEMLLEKIGLVVICITLITCFVFSPRKLILTNKELIVRCRAYSKHVPIKDIVSCTFHSEIIDGSTIRLFASGGFGGYYGLFWNSKCGKFKAFFGNRSSTFTLKLVSGEYVVLGCENCQSLINELTSIINRPQRCKHDLFYRLFRAQGAIHGQSPLRHILGRLTNHFSVYAVVRGCVGLPRKNPGAPKPIIV